MIEVYLEKSLGGGEKHITADFFVRPAERLAIMGRSGSGKSVTLKMLAGFLEADREKKAIFRDNGHSLLGTTPQTRNISYLFQSPTLFPHMSVWQNIIYGFGPSSPLSFKEKKERALHFLEELQITSLKERYPSSLSGGEAQRVALCRGVMKTPRIMLLDEPFAALDEETREECWEVLDRVLTELKLPCLLVTHSSLEAKALTDHTMKIENSKLCREG